MRWDYLRGYRITLCMFPIVCVISWLSGQWEITGTYLVAFGWHVCAKRRIKRYQLVPCSRQEEEQTPHKTYATIIAPWPGEELILEVVLGWWARPKTITVVGPGKEGTRYYRFKEVASIDEAWEPKYRRAKKETP